MDTTLQPMEMELVYSKGWDAEQGGGKLSAAPDSLVYEEAYDTAVWDEMLLVGPWHHNMSLPAGSAPFSAVASASR